MDYAAAYNALMNRSMGRQLEGYIERHHVWPKCMGGHKDGIRAVLTAREHFIAHQLLVKIYPDDCKLVFAMNMLTVKNGKGRPSSRRYAWLRRRYSQALRKQRSGMKFSPTHRKNLSLSKMGKPGRPCSTERREKISAALLGKSKSLAARSNMKGKRWSAERRAAASIQRKGRITSPEAREKLRTAALRQWSKRKQGDAT